MSAKTDLLLEAVKALYKPNNDYDGSSSPGAQQWLAGERKPALSPETVDNLTEALRRSTDAERALFATGLLQFLLPAIQALPAGVPTYIAQFVAQTLGRGNPA